MIKLATKHCLFAPRSALIAAALMVTPDAQADVERDFNIPAGEAVKTLRVFAEVSGHEILFSADRVRGVRTIAVSGRFTDRDALQLMLQGTGLMAVADEEAKALALVPDGSAPRASVPPNRTRFSIRALMAGFAIASANALAGQTVPAGPGTSATDKNTIVLSPFQVSASGDQGYIATNTLSGSRVNTQLYVTPSVTSVFTRDFLDDIGANDLVDAYAFGLNVDAEEQPEQSANFRGNIFSDNAVSIRGLPAATARNYFVWSVNGDSYNLERLDFSRGPNNILFGLGGQGGVVNSTTKQAALNRNITRLQLRLGDWDLYRGHIDLNRPIGKDIALRVNLLQHDEGGWRHHASYKKEALHLAGTWRVFNTRTTSTVLRAEFEKLHLDRVIAYNFPLQDSVSNWNGAGVPASGALAGVTGVATMPANRRVYQQSTGGFFLSTGVQRTSGPAATSFADETVLSREVNVIGPDNRNDSDVANITVNLEQRLFKDLFVEFAVNRQVDRSTYLQLDGFNLYRDPRLTVGGTANPRFGEYYAEFPYWRRQNNTRVDEARITASFERNLGKLGRHQLAALGSRRENASSTNEFNFDDIGTNSLLLFRRWLKDGDSNRFTGFDPKQVVAQAAAAGQSVGFRQNALTHNETRQDTAQIVHVGTFFSGRLTTIYGIRRDELFNRGVLNGTRTFATTEPLVQRRIEWNNFQMAPWSDVAADTTRTKGFTLGWSADSPVRVYYNVSESFVNQTGVLPAGLVERNNTFPPRRGEGRDMGMRFRLFDKRIQGSIGYFETNDVDARTFMNGNFPNSTQFVVRDLLKRPDYIAWQDTADLASKGYELEITANPTSNLRVHLNYSRTNLVSSNYGPRTKSILIGQLLPEWKQWVSGWRQGAGETLPAGVSNNTSPAVTVSALGRPLTFLEAHGNGIDPTYNIGDRRDRSPSTGTLGLADWINTVNWAADNYFQDGLPPRRQRPESFNFVANYSFSRDSRLKGWTVGGSARWRGKANVDRFFDASGRVVIVYGEPRTDTDLNLGYSRKFERFTLKTQLNVRNVFNSELTETINAVGNSAEHGHIQWRDPRSFRLTVDFIF